jgi:hypothetical protein
MLANDTDMEYLHIDSTAVIIHQYSADTKNSGPNAKENNIGHSCSDSTTKIHVLVDPVVL